MSYLYTTHTYCLSASPSLHLSLLLSSHLLSSFSLSLSLSLSEYRNKESSQTTLEAETDEAKSKDLKMQVTENKEISRIEKSTTTNLDLAQD